MNVDGSETPVGKVEHWESLYRGFANHGLTELFLKQFAGSLGVDQKVLVAAWTKTHDDFIKEAQKILDGSKK